MSSEIAEIVYAADRSFGEILGVSATSLMENSKDMKEIRLHIFDMGIAPEDKEKIEGLCRAFGRAEPHWIDAEDISRELHMHVDADRGSLAQFARIFLSRHLPEETERVLYLDCDTILRRSVRELWNLDLQGHTVGALLDAFSRFYRRDIGLSPRDVMFNSGVMLVDLKRWRALTVEERILAFIRSRQGFVEKGDQGALNAVLSHDCLCIDPKFNAVTIFYDFSYREMMFYRKPPAYYPRAAVEQAAADPALVHFTLSFLSKRPWMRGCEHPFAGEWLRYKAMSPWKDSPLREEIRQKRVYLMRRLPRPVMLAAAGLLQAYGRPALYRMRSRNMHGKRSAG